MALSRGERPILSALRPVPGSWRLVGLRFLLVTVSSAPALIAAFAGLSSGPAREPYFTEIGGRLPLVPFGRLMGSVFPAFAMATIACSAIAVLGDQFLTGGGLALLAAERQVEGRLRVLRTVRREGAASFWPFLRLILLALVLSGTGIVAIRSLFKALDRAGAHGGWTGATRLLTLPVLSMSLVMLWLATVGAWFFWCRVLTVADGRRRVRRTGPLALRIFWRHPLRSWGFFVATTLGSTLASGVVVGAWLQAEPKGGGKLLPWIVVWLLMLSVQAFVWHWLLRAGGLLYASGSLADLRLRTDAPLGLRSWMLRRLRRKPAIVPQPSAELTQEGNGASGRPMDPS